MVHDSTYSAPEQLHENQHLLNITTCILSMKMSIRTQSTTEDSHSIFTDSTSGGATLGLGFVLKMDTNNAAKSSH